MKNVHAEQAFKKKQQQKPAPFSMLLHEGLKSRLVVSKNFTHYLCKLDFVNKRIITSYIVHKE